MIVIDDVDIPTKAKLDIDACRHLKQAKILNQVVPIEDQLQAVMDDQYEHEGQVLRNCRR